MLIKISMPFLRLNKRGNNIQRVKSLLYHCLSNYQKKIMLDDIYDIYQETSYCLSKDEFYSAFLSNEDVNLCLFYDKDEYMVGFINLSVLFINDLEKREHGIFCAGVFFRNGYKGGKLAVLYGFSQFLKFKCRHLLTPVSYVTLVSNPAVYALLSENSHIIYPNKEIETPLYVTDILLKTAQARRIVIKDVDVLLTDSQAVPKNKHKFYHSKRLKDNIYAQYFIERNPDFYHGKAMLVYVELTVKSFFLGLRKCVFNLFTSKNK